MRLKPEDRTRRVGNSWMHQGSDGEDNGEDCWVWLGFGVGLSIC